MSVLRKRDQRLSAGSGEPATGSCSIMSSLPGLMEMLLSQTYPDGSRRVPSTLLLFVDGGMVKACLNDRDQGLAAWSSGDSVTTCLQAMEKALVGDTLEWRVQAGGQSKRRK
jgi:hypothetical protein